MTLSRLGLPVIAPALRYTGRSSLNASRLRSAVKGRNAASALARTPVFARRHLGYDLRPGPVQENPLGRHEPLHHSDHCRIGRLSDATDFLNDLVEAERAVRPASGAQALGSAHRTVVELDGDARRPIRGPGQI